MKKDTKYVQSQFLFSLVWIVMISHRPISQWKIEWLPHFISHRLGTIFDLSFTFSPIEKPPGSTGDSILSIYNCLLSPFPLILASTSCCYFLLFRQQKWSPMRCSHTDSYLCRFFFLTSSTVIFSTIKIWFYFSMFKFFIQSSFCLY